MLGSVARAAGAADAGAATARLRDAGAFRHAVSAPASAKTTQTTERDQQRERNDTRVVSDTREPPCSDRSKSETSAGDVDRNTNMRTSNNGWFCLLLLATSGCADSDSGDETMTPPAPASESAFSSVEVAASADARFTTPLSGTPLPAGGVAFIAVERGDDETPPHPALFRGSSGEEASVLYAGPLLQNPIDLDVSSDGASILVADGAHLDENGENRGGAILTFPVEGGEPAASAVGYQPRAVTAADTGAVYFSGRDPESGAPGVFELAGEAVYAVYVGAPLVDPSGIAVFGDGRLLVADTSFSDGEDSAIASRGAVVELDSGEARLFASGFETGYPAGLALTTDDRVLIVSGQGPDSSNLVFLFDTEHPDRDPLIETAFASEAWSSGGLHRAHGENRFAWCDRAAGGGTVYAIQAR